MSKQVDLREGFAWFRRLEERDPDTGKLSLSVAWKDEGETGKWLDKIEKAIDNLGNEKFGDTGKWRNPLKRGENCKAKGYASLSASSKFDVEVVGYNDNGEVVERKPRDVRKGTPVIMTVVFKPYDKGGNKGIAAYLKFVCVTSDKTDNEFLEASVSEDNGVSALQHFKPRKPVEAEEDSPSF